MELNLRRGDRALEEHRCAAVWYYQNLQLERAGQCFLRRIEIYWVRRIRPHNRRRRWTIDFSVMLCCLTAADINCQRRNGWCSFFLRRADIYSARKLVDYLYCDDCPEQYHRRSIIGCFESQVPKYARLAVHQCHARIRKSEMLSSMLVPVVGKELSRIVFGSDWEIWTTLYLDKGNNDERIRRTDAIITS